MLGSMQTRTDTMVSTSVYSGKRFPAVDWESTPRTTWMILPFLMNAMSVLPPPQLTRQKIPFPVRLLRPLPIHPARRSPLLQPLSRLHRRHLKVGKQDNRANLTPHITLTHHCYVLNSELIAFFVYK